MQKLIRNYIRNLEGRTSSFIVIFIIVFFILVAVAVIVDFYPERSSNAEAAMVPTSESRRSSDVTETGAEPVRIIIDAIGVNSSIENPTSRAISVLDDALLRGVVRFPGSGLLGDDGNMFLFGHSSSLPVVRNPAFKIFTRLSELKEGQTVRVQSKTHEYVYRVTSVRMAPASEIKVEFANGRPTLTIITCNSFGSKDDRYVVEADLVGSYVLPK
jgi:LPXTG-site transpeptidase (sortase) family protein